MLARFDGVEMPAFHFISSNHSEIIISYQLIIVTAFCHPRFKRGQSWGSGEALHLFTHWTLPRARWQKYQIFANDQVEE